MWTRYKTLVFLVLACLLALSATWLHNLWQEQQQFTEKVDESKVDYYLSDFSLMVTDETGKPQFSLKGEHFVHNRAQMSSEIYAPSFIVDTGNEMLTLIAPEAVQKPNQDIELRGYVVMEKPESPDNIGFTARTSDVTYSPVRGVIETDKKVVVKGTNNAEIKATGYYENLETGVVQLKESIHAEYLPATP